MNVTYLLTNIQVHPVHPFSIVDTPSKAPVGEVGSIMAVALANGEPAHVVDGTRRARLGVTLKIELQSIYTIEKINM